MILRHKNLKWRHSENLNVKTADIHSKIFGTLKLHSHIFFKKKIHYRLNFQRLNINFLEQWRFPLTTLQLNFHFEPLPLPTLYKRCQFLPQGFILFQLKMHFTTYNKCDVMQTKRTRKVTYQWTSGRLLQTKVSSFLKTRRLEIACSMLCPTNCKVLKESRHHTENCGKLWSDFSWTTLIW